MKKNTLKPFLIIIVSFFLFFDLAGNYFLNTEIVLANQTMVSRTETTESDWNDNYSSGNLVFSEKIEIESGKESGYRVSNPLPLDEIKKAGTNSISWESTEPTDTEVKIYTAITEDDINMPNFNKPSSCSDILLSGLSTGNGIYTISSDGLNEIDVYCDMITDDGGWTLVLLNSSYTTPPKSSWQNVININTITGTMSSNIDGAFDQILGLKFWNLIGDEMRVEVGSSSSSISHRAYFDFDLLEGSNYALSLSNQNITIGGTSPGIYTYHNGRQFTTYDADHDAYSSNCSLSYGNTPWWYGACWDGSFFGGGDSGSYQNKPFWTGSASDYYNWGAIWVRGDSDYSIAEFSENWQEATNGSSIPEINEKQDLSGKYLWILQELSTTNPSISPELESLSVYVEELGDFSFVEFTDDTEISLSGLSKPIYVSSGSKAGSVEIFSEELDINNIPSESFFKIKDSGKTVLEVDTDIGGIADFIFYAEENGEDYIESFDVLNSTGEVCFIFGVEERGFYEVLLDGEIFGDDYYLSVDGEVSFCTNNADGTYSISKKDFWIFTEEGEFLRQTNSDVVLVDNKWELKNNENLIDNKFDREVFVRFKEGKCYLSSKVEWQPPRGETDDILIEDVLTTWRLPEIIEYTLGIDSSTGGSVSAPGEGLFLFNYGDEVDISAVSEEGFIFEGWSGSTDTIENVLLPETKVTINGDVNITANFVAE